MDLSVHIFLSIQVLFILDFDQRRKLNIKLILTNLKQVLFWKNKSFLVKYDFPSRVQHTILYYATATVASVVSDSVLPRRGQPTRLLCPWDSPGKSTGVGCHCLLQYYTIVYKKICRDVSLQCWYYPDMNCLIRVSTLHVIRKNHKQIRLSRSQFHIHHFRGKWLYLSCEKLTFCRASLRCAVISRSVVPDS